MILVTNKTRSFSCLKFTDSKTRVFHAGILLFLVTHKTSSFSYWNFDSSTGTSILVSKKRRVFHGGILLLISDKT